MIDYRYTIARKKLSSIKRILLVCSGKGGVGKSIIAASIAQALAEARRNAGILDLDLHGPSIPLVLGIREIELHSDKGGLYPMEVGNLKVFSLYFLSRNKPIPIIGRVKEHVLLDLFSELQWGNLDYLVVDMPPGTGDETIIALRILKDRAKAVIVSTPSILSVSVVERLVSLLRNEKVGILGLIENMAYINCGGKVIEPFGPSKTDKLGLRVLGRLPLDPKLEEALSRGKGVTEAREYWRTLVSIAQSIERYWV